MNTSYFHKDFECLFDLFRCHLKADRNCCANVTAIIRNFNVYDSTLITVFFFDWSESNVTEWMVIDDCWMISGRYQSYKTSMIGDWIRDQSHESSIEIECYAINAIKVFPHCFQLRQFLFVWEIYDQSEKNRVQSSGRIKGLSCLSTNGINIQMKKDIGMSIVPSANYIWAMQPNAIPWNILNSPKKQNFHISTRCSQIL